MKFEELLEHFRDLIDLAQNEGYAKFAHFLRFAYNTALSLSELSERFSDEAIVPKP